MANPANKIKSDQEKKTYDNARAYLDWVTDLYIYYLNRLPLSDLDGVSVHLNGSQRDLAPELVKRIFGSLSEHGSCEPRDFENLVNAFSPEDLVKFGLITMRTMLYVRTEVLGQTLRQVKDRVLPLAQSDMHREVLSSFLEISEATSRMKYLPSQESPGPKERITDGASDEKAFAFYMVAPNCFKIPGVVNFVKMMNRLRSELSANEYLNLLREKYKLPYPRVDRFHSNARRSWTESFRGQLRLDCCLGCPNPIDFEP